MGPRLDGGGQRARANLLPADGIDQARRVHGLEPHPLAGLSGDVNLDICPPSLQGPCIIDAGRVHGLGPMVAPNILDSIPALDGVGDRPLVYVTLGTVFNRNVDLFRTPGRGVPACRRGDHPGREGHGPGHPRTQPPNVRVEQFVAVDGIENHGATPAQYGFDRISLVTPPLSRGRNPLRPAGLILWRAQPPGRAKIDSVVDG